MKPHDNSDARGVEVIADRSDEPQGVALSGERVRSLREVKHVLYVLRVSGGNKKQAASVPEP